MFASINSISRVGNKFRITGNKKVIRLEWEKNSYG